MQAMFDNAILDSTFIEPALVNSGVKSLTIHMEPHSLDELTRIWHALQEPYDLSNAYLVQFVPITSRREQPEPSPVLVKTTRYADILEAN
jgi:hypothetical protein